MAVAAIARPDERRRLRQRPCQDRPELSLETPVILRDCKRDIDATAWLTTEISHDNSDRALTSSVKIHV